MPIREILLQTVAALWANKLRSLLTMFGIVWGITSVILLVGLGIGFRVQQAEQLKSIGTDIAILFGGKTGMPSGGYAAGREINLNVDDATAIKREAQLVKGISPEITRTISQVSAWNATSLTVRGVWPEYQVFRSLPLDQGRFFTDTDEAEGRRVVLLGYDTNRQLFPGKPVLGETLAIAGYPYTVIGTLKKKKQNGSYNGGRDDTQLFVPFSAMNRDFPPTRKEALPAGYIDDLVVEPMSAALHEKALAEVTRVLAERHYYEPADKEAVWVWDTLDGAKFTDRIFQIMTMFFGAVALLTLALGGIGVMNIMLVAVTERTREIGVRKALGATAKDIRRQFFAESAIITLISGTCGLALGVGVCVLLRLLPLPDFLPLPVISLTAIVASLTTLGAITVAAGSYPALRAASLTPIECLRLD